MKGINKLLIGKFLALGLMTAAYADMPNPFGWYVEGNLGKTYVSNKFYGANTNIKNTGRGWSIAGGYKFNHYFAAEVGYTQYAMLRIRNPVPTVVGNDHDWSADLAGKGILPIWDTGFELFGKAGIGRMYSYTTLTNPPAAALFNIHLNTGTHSTTKLYAGGGIDYAMTENLIANIQCMRQYGSRLTGAGVLASGGLAWIF